jgi:hypothetical protein
MRVTASQSSVHEHLDLPTAPAADLTGETDPTGPRLRAALGLKGSKRHPEITSTRRLIYEFDPGTRLDPEAAQPRTEALQEPPPTLELPALPTTLVAGRHYVVTEVLFTLDTDRFGPVHWRAFVEETTGAVVYLRAFVACATAMVFATDPATAGAVVLPTAPAAQLNSLRTTVSLDGLSSGNPQGLSGEYVEIVDIVLPVAVPPTAPNPPASFAYDAPAREFAAVNAYHHCDWLFRLMAGMGFDIPTYFDGTTFPVPVDAVGFNDQVNAQAPGNATGTGSGGFQFGLAGSPFPAVSIAADRRVVLHEFGHTLLWDSVHSPNFGFAHSAGDSLAAVLMDPQSSLRTDPVRRFETFPWVLPNRNHGRSLAAGWAWGGVRDVGGYSSEQILSTTHFRLYRSLGGDSPQLARRRLAARQVVYLIFRGIGSLAGHSVTPTPRPNVLVTALSNADIGTADFEGYRGGTFHKVIRWAFEQQGLFQPPGTPGPVTTPGAPPAVDVYVDDGRGGGYGYQPVHWECTEIWNRLTQAGGTPADHETPVVGQTNFAYVRVRNRGTGPATGVVVRGYSADPGVGLTWPGDWTPMQTAQITVPGSIPSGGATVVGPFAWVPDTVGHECMFMEVSANGDLSNIDPATFFPCATGPTAEWRLVPFDNNLAQRNVCPVPGGGGADGLLTGFAARSFTVHNPLPTAARMEVRAELPALLADRGWEARLSRRAGSLLFDLAAGAHRQVTVGLEAGTDFTTADVTAAAERTVRVLVSADDGLIGGMSYVLDPALASAPAEQPVPDDGAVARPRSAAAGRRAAPTEVIAMSAAGAAPDGLLARLGLAEGIRGARRVTVRETTVEIDLGS